MATLRQLPSATSDMEYQKKPPQSVKAAHSQDASEGIKKLKQDTIGIAMSASGSALATPLSPTTGSALWTSWRRGRVDSPLLGRTAVECTRDALGDRIGLDVASVAARMPSNQLAVIDPFAGSCNTLFWILRHLPSSGGIAFESDPQVFAITLRNLAALDQRIELVHGHYVRILEERRVPQDRGIVAFVAPP